MTPQQQADKIFDRFKQTVPDLGNNGAIDCSKVAVELIVNELIRAKCDEELYTFWNKVDEEISNW